MVDTTDSKSVASNRVRVQVSSPVFKLSFCWGKLFLFNHAFCRRETELWLEDELEPVAR